MAFGAPCARLAVHWQTGDMHETATDTGLTALVLEAEDFEVPSSDREWIAKSALTEQETRYPATPFSRRKSGGLARNEL